MPEGILKNQLASSGSHIRSQEGMEKAKEQLNKVSPSRCISNSPWYLANGNVYGHVKTVIPYNVFVIEMMLLSLIILQVGRCIYAGGA